MEKAVTVLIVDDESSIRNGLKTAIPWEQIPATVIALAANGNEAMTCIREHHPDIVVADVRMPEKGGLELIQESKEAGFESEFIILSGYNDFIYAQEAIKWGARSYILKPYKTEDLTGELKKLAATIISKKTKQNFLSQNDLPRLKDASKKFFLNQLIQNEIREDEIEESVISLQLTIQPPLTALVFTLYAKTEKAAPVCASLAENILTNFFAEKPAEIVRQNANRITVILQTIIDAAVHKTAQKCLDSLSSIPECVVCVGIGNTVSTFFLCHKSYNSALIALSYRLYKPDCALFDSSIISDSKPQININAIDTDALVDAICRNSISEISKNCEDFFYSLFYVPMPPPGYVRGMCIYLTAIVQKELIKHTGVQKELFERKASLDINNLISFYEIKNSILDLFYFYAAEIMPLIANTNDNVIRLAKKYIEQHLENGVSAEAVAAQVHLSTSYFPIYFKAKTGINYRDYLLEVKNNHAKTMLENSAISVETVSEKLGYADYRAFYRAFKKQTGKTPSEYRKQYDVRSFNIKKEKHEP